MAHSRTPLTLLAVALAAGTFASANPERAKAVLHAQRPQLGLDGEHSFKAMRSHKDGDVDVDYMQQHFRGLKVWGGQAAIRDDGRNQVIAGNYLYKNIQATTTATLAANEVLAIAAAKLGDAASFLAEPTSELVIVPQEEQRVRSSAAHKAAHQLNAEDMTNVVMGYRLAYHVATDAEVNGRRELMNFLVDANSGEILNQWNMVKRTTATGTAQTKYSGNVTLYTNLNGSTYEAKDPIYYNNYVSSSTSSTTPYTDADNAWGNGGNYADGTTEAKQTGAAEALWDLHVMGQMYKAVFGRNGSSGTGKAMKVVWGQYPAANTSCYITLDYIISGYADNYFYDMNKLDILGHEYGHSFDRYTSYLCSSSSGEAGGMAEAHADIMGLLSEVYGKYGIIDPNNPNYQSTTIPEAGLTDPKTWICGEDAAKSVVNGGKGLRFFIKPSLDTMEGTINAWKSTMSTVEVHAAAGPTDRMFYYLAVGAPSSTTHDGYTTYLPNGSTGIGLHKAAEIWVKTILSGQLSSSSTHLNARNACIATAKTLYGAGSAEEQAVWNAYAGINVGSVWTVPTTTVTMTPTTATVKTGATFQFTASVTNNTNTAVTWSVTEANGGTVNNGLYTAPTTEGTFHIRATSAADATKFAEATVTVSNNTGTELLLNGGFESGTTSWTATSGTIGTFTQQLTYEGTKNLWLGGNGKKSTETAYQTVTIPSTATSATLSFYMHIDTAETTTTTANDKGYVQVLSSTGSVLGTLATYSNLNATSGYVQKTFDLTAYKGKTVRVYFKSVEDRSLQTSFVFDKVSLIVK